LIDRAATEVDAEKRKALYAEWVAAVNEEIPVWMITERQFFAATNKQVRNHHNVPRWDSSDWHDTWIASS
jgi:peptide/nickel transport system substrate-binding protein